MKTDNFRQYGDDVFLAGLAAILLIGILGINVTLWICAVLSCLLAAIYSKEQIAEIQLIRPELKSYLFRTVVGFDLVAFVYLIINKLAP